jgi:hypothetical protein
LCNEEIHNLYSSQNIIIIVKWKRIKWTVCIIYMEKMRNTYKILVEVSLGDLGIDGSLILKWILRNWVWACGLSFSGSGLGVAVDYWIW